jgi:hypothetical protein
MSPQIVPRLLTAGRIADEAGVPLARAQYILATRRHIRPVARAGTLRLFDEKVIAQVRYEANCIDARRHERKEAGRAS